MLCSSLCFKLKMSLKKKFLSGFSLIDVIFGMFFKQYLYPLSSNQTVLWAIRALGIFSALLLALW